MKKILSIISLLCLYQFSFAQELCDTKPDSQQEKKAYLQRVQESHKMARLSATQDEILIPLTLHIIRDANGNGGITEEEFRIAFDRLNSIYAPAGIRYYLCGNILYHDDNDWDTFEKNDDRSKLFPYNIDNTFNLWIVDNYTSGGVSSCGFAYYPSNSSADMSVLKTSCVANGTSLEHELGHGFDLRHTHSTTELVARPNSGKTYNCDTDGDGFCDTPADPSLSGKVSSTTCLVTSSLGNDTNGDTYTPDPHNIMSYSSKSCRSYFSPEQYAHMRYIAETHSDRTKFKCETAPTANFNIPENMVAVGQDINFNNWTTGTPNFTYEWTFSNANISTSSQESPTVSFTTVGEHSVTLKVTNAYGSHSVTKKVNVIGAIALPYSQDFTDGSSILDTYGIDDRDLSQVEIASYAGFSGNGLALGGPTTPLYYTKGQEEFSFISNYHYTSQVSLVGIDATNFIDLSLKFDAKLKYYSNPFYTNFRILIDGKAITPIYTIASNNDEEWIEYTIDLSDYDGKIFNLTFESNCKYGTDRNAVYIDNILIDGTEDNTVTNTVTSQETENFIYPNPFQNELNIQLPSNGKSVISVYTIQGQLIDQKEQSQDFVSIPTDHYSNGMYLLKITQENKIISSSVIIKE